MAFQPWHDWRPLIEAADNWEDRQKLIDMALSQDNVRAKDGMLIQVNADGRAYDCMSQGDMATVLIRNGVKFNSPKHIELGMKCLQVNCNSIDQGGLRKPGTGISWYHGMTGRDTKYYGWTLNKHLHAVRSFLDCANAINDPSFAEVWREYAKRGIRQLDAGTPNLADFIACDRSWLYYQLDNKMVGRFLEAPKDANKNGGYHLYCMNLMATIAKRGDVRWFVGFTGALRKVYAAYRTKLVEGLYKDSTPCTKGCYIALHDTEFPLDSETTDFWNAVT